MNGLWKLLAVTATAMVLIAGHVSSSRGTSLAASSQQGATAPSNPVTLKIAGIQYGYTPTVIAAFMKRNPTIKVNFSGGNVSFENGQIQTVLRSGHGPDVLLINSGPGRVGLLSSQGLIRSLDDVYKKYNITERYQKWVIDQIRTQGKGHIYEIVEGADVFQVYYNKEIFSKQGLQPPRTWAQFLADCNKLKEAGVLPIVAGVRDNFAGGWLMGTLVQASAGKDIMTNVIYGTGNFDQPKIVRGAQMLKDLVSKGYINGYQAAALTADQADAAFTHGRGAMIVFSQGHIISAQKNGVDVSKFGSFLMPSLNAGQPAQPIAGLAHSWVVDVNTKKMSAVEKWLNWVSSDDYLKIAVAHGGSLVPTLKVPQSIKLPPAIQDAAAKLEKGAGYNPSVYLPAAAKDAWYAAVQQLITGQASPEQAMKQIQSALAESRHK